MKVKYFDTLMDYFAYLTENKVTFISNVYKNYVRKLKIFCYSIV